MTLRPFVSGRGAVPSGFESHRFSAPLRSLMKTRLLPSGEKRGWLSKDRPPTIRLAWPPAIGSVYRSPSRSNTMVWPSGETSRDIHVPSSVVNSRVSAVLSGSSSSSFFLSCSSPFLRSALRPATEEPETTRNSNAIRPYSERGSEIIGPPRDRVGIMAQHSRSRGGDGSVADRYDRRGAAGDWCQADAEAGRGNGLPPVHPPRGANDQADNSTTQETRLDVARLRLACH